MRDYFGNYDNRRISVPSISEKTKYEQLNEIKKEIIIPAIKNVKTLNAAALEIQIPVAGDLASLGVAGCTLAEVIDKINEYLNVNGKLTDAELLVSLRFVINLTAHVATICAGTKLTVAVKELLQSAALWTGGGVVGGLADLAEKVVKSPALYAILSLPTTTIANMYTVYSVADEYATGVVHKLDSVSKIEKTIALEVIKGIGGFGTLANVNKIANFIIDFAKY